MRFVHTSLVARWSLYALIWILPLTLVSRSTAAEDSLPFETLTALKAATVFLKVDTNGNAARGTGFVIQSDAQAVYVVTNHHVVHVVGKPTITAIFGSGTTKEQTAPAELIADDSRRDLAVLKVANLKTPPKPIDMSQQPKLAETMPLFILGFPLGEALATGKGNPAITVGKGSVSSIRLKDTGDLATVQVDGDITPGNSGGPVVDNQGRLVGVAQATIANRRIGFAIPAQELVGLLQGRVLDYHFVTKPAGDKLSVRVELAIFDPFNRLKGVSFYYLRGEEPAEKKLASVAAASKVNLGRDLKQLVGDFSIQVPMNSEMPVTFQAIYTDGEGKTFITNPRSRKFGNAPPRPVVVKRPAEPVGPGGPAAPRPNVNPAVGEDTKFVGGQGGFGVSRYAEPGKPVLGFDYTEGNFIEKCIARLIPVYDPAQTPALGSKRVIAKSGYAVAAVTVRTSKFANAIQITFNKLSNGKLDPKESYKSGWIGGADVNGNDIKLGGDGRLVIGVGCKQGAILDAMCLVMEGKNDAMAIAPADDAPAKPKEKSRLTQANFEKILTGMNEQQVVGILGDPSSKGNAGNINVHTWNEGRKMIQVRFRNGKVSGKTALNLEEAMAVDRPRPAKPADRPDGPKEKPVDIKFKGRLQVAGANMPMDMAAWGKTFRLVKMSYSKSDNELIIVLQAGKNFGPFDDGYDATFEFLDEDGVNIIKEKNLRWEKTPKDLRMGEATRVHLTLPDEETLKKAKKCRAVVRGFFNKG